MTHSPVTESQVEDATAPPGGARAVTETRLSVNTAAITNAASPIDANVVGTVETEAAADTEAVPAHDSDNRGAVEAVSADDVVETAANKAASPLESVERSPNITDSAIGVVERNATDVDNLLEDATKNVLELEDGDLLEGTTTDGAAVAEKNSADDVAAHESKSGEDDALPGHTSPTKSEASNRGFETPPPPKRKKMVNDDSTSSDDGKPPSSSSDTNTDLTTEERLTSPTRLRAKLTQRKHLASMVPSSNLSTVSDNKMVELLTGEQAYVLLPLDTCVEYTYPHPQLRRLAEEKHPAKPKTPPRPVYYVLLINGYHLKHEVALSPLLKKLLSFYTKTFDGNDLDKVAIENMFADGSKQVVHMMVLSTGRGVAYPLRASGFSSIYSALSCAIDKSSGTVLLWTAVDSDSECVNIDGTIGSYQQRGLGTFQVVLLQFWLDLCNFSHCLWVQFNTVEPMPAVWYREKLFFAPVMRPKQLSGFVKRHLIDDTSLVTYHSTGLLSKCIRFDALYSPENANDLLEYVEFILSSYQMPRLRVRRAQNGVHTTQLVAMKNLLLQNKEGVKIADKLRSNGKPKKPIHGDQATLKEAWNQLVASNPEAKCQFINLQDNGAGELTGIEEEKSCLYLCLSKSIFGNSMYYWRLRMIAAHLTYSLSFLPDDHPLLDENTSYIPHVLKADLDQIEEKKDHDNMIDQKLPIKERLRDLSKKIIRGRLDAGQLELNLIAATFKCNVSKISCRCNQKKPAESSRQQKRSWMIDLNDLATSGKILQVHSDEDESTSAVDKHILLGHVEDCHYVSVQLLARKLSRKEVMLNAMTAQTLPTDGAEVSEYAANVSASVAEELLEEYRSNANRQSLYTFPSQQTKFEAALHEVRLVTTVNAEKAAKECARRKRKIQEEVDEVEKGTKKNCPHRANIQFYDEQEQELRRRLRADRANEAVEASLLLKNSVTHLELNNGIWTGVFYNQSTKRQETVELEGDWVKNNFHEVFVSYMEKEGGIDVFRPTPAVVNLPDDARHPVEYLCTSMELHYHFITGIFTVELTAKAIIGRVNEKDGGVKYGKSQTFYVTGDWVAFHMKQRDSAVEYDTICDDVKSQENTSDNCPCFSWENHEHTEKCYRQATLSADDTDEFTFQRDDRQIQALRWNKDLEQWQGLHTGCTSITRKTYQVPLEEDWVRENFPNDFLIDVQQECERQHKYVKIPPGDPSREFIIPEPLRIENAPTIDFPQEGKKTCLTDSIASALSFMGEPTKAKQVHEFGLLHTQNGCGVDVKLLGMTREFVKSFGRNFVPHKIGRTFNLVDPATFHPSLRAIILLADDGDTGHAICTVDQWIFDSSLPTALPLCKDALDYCCGKDRRMVGVFKGYHFKQHEK